MQPTDDEPIEIGTETATHEKFGGCLLVFVLLGLAVVVVVDRDVPYVDDAVEELRDVDPDEVVARLRALLPADEQTDESTDTAEEPAPDEEPPRETESDSPQHDRPTEHAGPDPSPTPPPYDGPDSAYRAPGFDPDPGPTEVDMAAGDTDVVLSDAQIQEVVNGHKAALADCYADALTDDPDLAGTVEFDFAVAPDGNVQMVRVIESTLESKVAEDCFVKLARGWRFPETAGQNPTRFQHDMTFSH